MSSSRQEPRLVKALEMVAPGTALREGIDNILHARTGGLMVIGDPDELAFLYSGGIKLDIDYTPALLYQVAKMDGAIVLNANATRIAWANVQLMPDPTILSLGDRHAAPHRRARLQADRRAGGRHLPAPRGRLALRRRREVHPRGHPRGAGQGQSGAGHARQVPHAPGPGLHPPDRPGVRGRRHAARRTDRPAARRARDAHGRRDRALHRRARHRGPSHRDAARGDHGRDRGRQGCARPRLLCRGLRRARSRQRWSRSAGCPTRTSWTSGASPSSSATTAS